MTKLLGGDEVLSDEHRKCLSYTKQPDEKVLLCLYLSDPTTDFFNSFSLIALDVRLIYFYFYTINILEEVDEVEEMRSIEYIDINSIDILVYRKVIIKTPFIQLSIGHRGGMDHVRSDLTYENDVREFAEWLRKLVREKRKLRKKTY